MGFVSQVGQDKWVCEKLNYLTKGYFVDIGASNGVLINNSFYLEKELGWSGICVEIQDELFAELCKHRNCICVRKGIYSHNGVAEFMHVGSVYGVKSSLQYDNVLGSGDEINVITMKTLLDYHGAPKVIDYISLDTTGNDYHVLLGFPFDEREVKLWTIEHNAYLDGGAVKEQIRALMLAKGYALVSDEEKHVYPLGTPIPEVNDFEDWFYHPKYIK